jgi:hypothetical protein
MAKKTKKHAKSTRTNKPARAKARRPKQQTLPAPGMARDVHPDIEAASSTYADAKISHRASTEEVTQAQKALLAAMKEHGVERCIVDVDGEEHIVEIESDERAKLRKYDADKEARKAAKLNGASNSAGHAQEVSAP